MAFIKTHEENSPRLKTLSVRELLSLPQVKSLDREWLRNMEVTAEVIPVKVSNYVIENLINWENPLDDPIFRMTFPQPGMLSDAHFQEMGSAFDSGNSDRASLAAENIRSSLNPNGSAQESNVPRLLEPVRELAFDPRCCHPEA